ncbi:MAG: 3-deoxy-7-phosphoheptulonate synthase [Bdellovibrionota bacterium]
MDFIPGQSESSSAQVIPVKVGNFVIGQGNFTAFAGPCSIESYEQFSAAAKGVQKAGAVMLRGGMWKLRTSSTTFQGLGGDAFEIVKKVKKETGLPFVSEITDPRQIDEIYDIVDMFQVGSRNMHNYALLKELGLYKKPVLLKRGFAALVTEWVKAAEYISQGGNDQIVLCERGIRTFETSTRNTLDLNAVVFAKENTPYPVIVDPSHAVGVRSLVPQLAYASAAAGADGIIVEVHPRPDEALSDKEQALSIESFAAMMKQLEKVLAAFDRTLIKPAQPPVFSEVPLVQ